jgi:hypothetical protein
MAWAKNGTPDTLSCSGDTLSISDLTAYKFNQTLSHHLQVTANISTQLEFDGNANADYARRRSSNGACDTTETCATDADYGNSNSGDIFEVNYIINLDGEEKLVIGFSIEAGSTTPSRTEFVGKVDTTTNSGQFTRIDIDNVIAGSYDTGSNLSAIGTD